MSARWWLTSAYAWLCAVFAGGTFIDMAYARVMQDTFGTATRSRLFAEIADLLLLMGGATVLVALAALVSAWESPAARNLLIASLIVFSLEFLAPVLLAVLLRGAQSAGIGPWVRMLSAAAASILAFAGLCGLRPRA